MTYSPIIASTAKLVLLAALLVGGTHARSAKPICGKGKFKIGNTGFMQIEMPDQDRADVTLTFPFSKMTANNPRFTFDKGAGIRTEFSWPFDKFSPILYLTWEKMSENNIEAKGIVQLECGSRNMGLVNYKVSFGRESSDNYVSEDSRDCAIELINDGRFRISIVKDVEKHLMLSGKIDLQDAKLRAAKFIGNEIAREKAGKCEFETFDIIVT